MSEFASLARPYVRAIFDIARESGELGAFSDQLALIARIATDPAVRALDGNPRVTREHLAELVLDVAGEALSPKAQNLVRLLAHNRRLAAAGEIHAQYERLKAEAENVLEAEVETATELDDGQRQRIADALEAKVGRTVRLTLTTNPELLGGAVIRTGDWVYDGSVRGQLEKMTAALNA